MTADPVPVRLVPPGARSMSVPSGGGTWRVLRSITEGSGTPVLLIHGGGSDSAAISWYLALGALSVARPVYAPDLPGFGATTGVPLLGDPAATAGQIVALADELGLERFLVAGVSMGGDIALNLALDHPDRAVAVVAVAAGGLIERFRNGVTQLAAWLAAQAPDPVLRAAGDVANRFMPSVLPTMAWDPERLPSAAVAEFLAESRRPGSGFAYGLYNRATLGPRRMGNYLLPRLADLAVPALLFHGQRDALVPPQGSVDAAEVIPEATLVTVPDCGHWAQLEAHDEFVHAVTEFTATHDL